MKKPFHQITIAIPLKVTLAFPIQLRGTSKSKFIHDDATQPKPANFRIISFFVYTRTVSIVILSLSNEQ